jgi:hypothetical protein
MDPKIGVCDDIFTADELLLLPLLFFFFFLPAAEDFWNPILCFS